MKKTLLVGLDAACWDYLQPLLEAGRLPTLQSLIDSGTRGTLASTLPALTPVAWASIITGKNPGKHGVFDMVSRLPGSNEFALSNARMRHGTPFWQRLNERGTRVGLVNIPFTYPFDHVDGFWVGGFGTPGSVRDVAYPEGLLTWIDRNVGSYDPAIDPEVFESAPASEIFKAERNHQAQQVRIAAELSCQNQVEVLAINLMLLDHANHLMPDMDLVHEAICQSDNDLDILIQAFEPDNVMLISDHGSRRVKGIFLLHAWLREHGYTVQVARSRSGQDSALNWVLLQWFQKGLGWTGFFERVFRRAGRAVVPHLPRSLAERFWNMVEKAVPFAGEHVAFQEQIDLARSRVLPGASYSGVLYWNVFAQDSAGPIDGKKKAASIAELVQKLSEIRDPETGQTLFSGVYTPEAIYRGPAATFAPDIILNSYDSEWNVMTTYTRGALAGRARHRYFVDNRKDFGHHGDEGIFVFSGQDFEHDTALHEGHVMDIPATLLHLYNVGVPDDYDGRVLTECIDPAYISEFPISYQSGDGEFLINEEVSLSLEDDKMMGMLRALGYLD